MDTGRCEMLSQSRRRLRVALQTQKITRKCNVLSLAINFCFFTIFFVFCLSDNMRRGMPLRGPFGFPEVRKNQRDVDV